MKAVSGHPDPNWPLIVVVTPYHREPLKILRRCHDSVLAQRVNARVMHVMIADGHPRPEIDGWAVRHLRLPNAHGDDGNTPRAIGATFAQANKADFIAYLDADNWYYPEHLGSMLAAHYESGASVCCCWRDFYDANGRRMAVTEPGEDTLAHVDTNCVLVHRFAFEVNATWANLPHELIQMGDKIFMMAVKHKRFSLHYTRERTVAYTTLYSFHYKLAGIEPPPNAKIIDGEKFNRYLSTPEGVRDTVRLFGFWPGLT